MRRTLALAILTSLVSFANATVKILDLRVTDSSGRNVEMKVGEQYYLCADILVLNQTRPYSFTYSTPDRNKATPRITFGVRSNGTYHVVWGTFVPLYDGAQSISVSCTSASSIFSKSFTPTPSNSAIESFNSKTLSASWGASVTLDRTTKQIAAWLPVPIDSSNQTVLSSAWPGGAQQLSNESGDPAEIVSVANSRSLSVQATSSVLASGVRISAAQLSSVPMSSISRDEFRSWLSAETRAQSSNAQIVNFAKTATRGMTSSTSVYDAAKAIYQSILSRSTYTKRNSAPDALYALQNRKGECGDLSALFVASCRAVGIPARAVTGFATGTSQWHVWAEFNVPGYGWVSVDPAYAVTLQPKATTPLYFGVIPEMNNRIAMSVGFSHSVGGFSTDFLQTPQVYWTSGSRMKSGQLISQLVVSANQP